MTVRTRFAPSPTGDLHIGGVRTALFCFLYAKKHGGTYILRIEDTDVERSTQASKQVILDALDWVGLPQDEGPYYQSERMDYYIETVQKLLNTGHAYRCYCTKARLATLREDQINAKEKPRYDGRCRDLPHYPTDVPHVIRFRNPLEGEVVFDDAVHGRTVFANKELDDLILAREDGTPTYQLGVVVDDAQMQITHVIRGDDHLNNTPRQINIFKALGLTPPEYAHVPMILAQDGKRLSKRHGAASVLHYRNIGVLPDALLNYLVRLGWSHGDQEIFSRAEMIEFFDIHGINKAAAAFDEQKLLWLNQHYMKTMSPAILAPLVEQQFETLGISINTGPSLETLIPVMCERAKTLQELAQMSTYFYTDALDYATEEGIKFLSTEALSVLQAMHSALITLPQWQQEALHLVIQNVCENLGLKMGKVAPCVRVAVTGRAQSPSLDITLFLLGREKTLVRLQDAIDYIKEGSEKL